MLSVDVVIVVGGDGALELFVGGCVENILGERAALCVEDVACECACVPDEVVKAAKDNDF